MEFHSPMELTMIINARESPAGTVWSGGVWLLLVAFLWFWWCFDDTKTWIKTYYDSNQKHLDGIKLQVESKPLIIETSWG